MESWESRRAFPKCSAQINLASNGILKFTSIIRIVIIDMSNGL